jgi:hypothetical protein
MGRRTTPCGKPPNPSGKVIFYEARIPKRGRSLAERQIQDEAVKAVAQGSKKKANVQRRRSSSILFNDPPGTTSIAPQTNPLPLSISPTQDLHDSPPSPIMGSDSPSNLTHHAGASAQILLRLLKDACDLFHQVPYVKVVAGLVQEIIKISEVCVTF